MDLASPAHLADPTGGASFGIVAAVFVAGFRHGFDIDHIAAITDITSSPRSRRSAFVLATIYALGHMLVVFALGVAAVLVGARIPASIDAIVGRVVGATLIAMGAYVIYTLIRYRRDFRMRSRWMVVVAGARRALLWLRPRRVVVVEHEHEHNDEHHDHPHPTPLGTYDVRGEVAAVATQTAHSHKHKHVVPMPSDPFIEYSAGTSLLVGMVHGVGAETPTQILLFTTAVGVAGSLGGIGLVAVFVGALLLGNTILALIASFGFAAGKKMPLLYMGLAAVTAIVSVYIGGIYLLDLP